MNFIRISVIIFSFVTLGIGIWSYFKIRGKAVNYFKAGAMMPVWVVAISLIAPSIDANGSIGAAARSAEYGFWAGACIPIGLAICMFLLGRYFAEPIWKMNIMTLPDFMLYPFDDKDKNMKWGLAEMVDIPKEEQDKYPIPGQEGKFYARKYDTDKAVIYEKFYEALSFINEKAKEKNASIKEIKLPKIIDTTKSGKVK